MGRLLRIFVFISLVLGGKTDRIEETTQEFQTAYQSTTLTNELQHAVNQNAAEIIRNFSSPTYNNQYTHNSSFKKLEATYSNRFFPSSTSETFYKNIFNFTTTGELEVLNNNSFNETEIDNTNMPGQSPSSTDNSNNFSEQITHAPILPENEIQNKNVTLNLEFQNVNMTTSVTFVGNEDSKMTPYVTERVTSFVQNISTQNSSRIEIENILNTFSELSKNSSFSSHFTLYDLDENSTTTQIPETDTEEHLLNTSVTMNTLLKNVETSENSFEVIMNTLHSVPTTTDIIEVYSTHLDNSNFQETETSSSTLSTLSTTNIRNSSERFVEATSVSMTSENETLNSMYSMHVTTSAKTNNFPFNSSIENNNVIKQEHSISVNQSSIMKNYTENKTSIIPTQQTIVATQAYKQKEANNSTTVFRNNDFKEKEITISSATMSSTTHTSSRSFEQSEDSVQTTSPGFPSNENVSLKISRSPMPTVVTQGHQQKEFFFKHINNLTDNQRNNMTIDIIFISAVDIVEWFHSYDRVFRTTIASLLTQTNESQSTQSLNIIYIAPTPLKNEKYFCITFMVESVLHKNIYEHGETIVQKLKQNVSELEQTLHLPVESVEAGYNETGKCHRSYRIIQERNWVIIVVLGTILTVAIVVILTMCIQKSRNGKQSWEQDVQEWNATIHGETGRYHSGYQLSINVQNPSNNIIDNLSRVNQKVSSKEENNSCVPNNGVENVLIHNEVKNSPETLCGECNKMFVEDTKL